MLSSVYLTAILLSVCQPRVINIILLWNHFAIALKSLAYINTPLLLQYCTVNHILSYHCTNSCAAFPLWALQSLRPDTTASCVHKLPSISHTSASHSTMVLWCVLVRDISHLREAFTRQSVRVCPLANGWAHVFVHEDRLFQKLWPLII